MKSATFLDLDFNPCSYESNWEEILFLCSATFDEIVCDEKWVNYALKKLKVIVLSEGKKLCMIILHIQWYFLHIRGQQSRKIDCIAPRIYISLCAEYNLKSFIHSFLKGWSGPCHSQPTWKASAHSFAIFYSRKYHLRYDSFLLRSADFFAETLSNLRFSSWSNK